MKKSGEKKETLSVTADAVPAAPPFGFAIFPRPEEVFPEGGALPRGGQLCRTAKKLALRESWRKAPERVPLP